MTKAIYIITMTALITPINGVVEKYFFSDWEYLKYLLVIVLGNTFLGFYKHWKRKTVSSKAWGKIVTKLITYSSLLIVAHVLSSFTIQGNEVSMLKWINTTVYTALMVKEGISIFENLGAINNKLVPKWILTKLKEFDDTGKFKSE